MRQPAQNQPFAKFQQLDPNTQKLYFFTTKTYLTTQSTRSQISLSQSQEQPSLALQPKNSIQQRSNYQIKRKLSPVEFIPMNSEILELYDQYAKNYTLLSHAQTISRSDKKRSVWRLQDITSLDAIRISKSCDETDQFIDIENRVTVQRFKFYYFRIHIKGKQSPLSLCFNFSERVLGLKIYLSTVAEFPSAFNSDQLIQSKYAIVVAKNRSKRFHENYVFLSLHCETDTKLKVSASFGKEAEIKSDNHQAKLQLDNQSKLITELSLNEIQVNTVYPLPTDKIQRNMNVTQNCSAKKLKFMFDLPSERILKQRKIMQNKQNITDETKLLQLLKYRTRQIIPQYRQLEKIVQQKANYILTFQIYWFQVLLVLQLADSLFNFLEVKKLITCDRKKSVARLLAWRFKTLLVMEIKQNGNTMNERCLNKAKQTLKFFCLSVKYSAQQKAAIVLYNVLNQTVPVMTIKNRICKVRRLVLNVQIKFRWHKAQKKQFYDRFWKQMNSAFMSILSELQSKNQFDKPTLLKRPSVFLVDTNAMSPILENFLLSSKQQWMEYIRYTKIQKYSQYSIQFPSQMDKMKAVAYSMKEPRSYLDPSSNDLIGIIEQYALMKNLL